MSLVPKKKQSKKKIKKLSSSKKKMAGILTATIIAGSSFFILKSGNHKFILPAYESIEVYDGDTFMTKEKQKIRLASVDAPEKDRCGYQEAKQELGELITNKPLYLKVRFFDLAKRLVSYVYSTQGSVNVQMVKSGWGRANTLRDSERDALLEASKYAKEHQLGVYSSLCLSKEPDKPGCLIKGNISNGTIKKYLLPGCTGYPITLVEKDLGDSWFCTEAEAKKAGFKRAGGCAVGIKIE